MVRSSELHVESENRVVDGEVQLDYTPDTGRRTALAARIV